MVDAFQIGPVPSVDDIEFIERLGRGLGVGRFRARLLASNEVVSLLFEQSGADPVDFIEWALQLASISHPGVPRVCQLEEVLEPRYLACEYIDGQNLEARIALRGQGLDELESLSIVLQVAAALRASHAAGVAHGGITPRSVILIPRTDALDAVRVVGWVPLPNTFEQACARDLHALGSLLFTCITGVLPPSMQRVPEAEGLVGDGGDFDDILMGWVEVDRDLGEMGRPALEALADSGRFANVEAFISEMIPQFQAQLAYSMTEVSQQLTADREFHTEVEKFRGRQRELESKLRFVREWLRANADHIDEREASINRLSRRERGLENLEMEMSMLLERTIHADASALPTRTAIVDPPPAELLPERFQQAESRVEPEPLIEVEPETQVIGKSGSPLMMVIGLLATVALGGVIVWALAQPEPESEPGPPPQVTQIKTVTPPVTLKPDAAKPDAAKPDAAKPDAAKPDAAVPQPDRALVDAQPSDAMVFVPVETGPISDPPKGMVAIPAGQVKLGLTPAQLVKARELCKAEIPKKHHKEQCNGARFSGDGTQREAKVGAFYIDKFEVSQGAYTVCRRAGKCADLWLTWELEEQPATGVTQEMAQVYCKYRKARLPTADEWSRAARGDSNRLYPWEGTALKEGKAYRANIGQFGSRHGVALSDDGFHYASPVKAFAKRGASPFGVANLAGNVREWTSTKIGKQGIVAGGGWHDVGIDQRVTRRQLIPIGKYSNELGFRCVVDIAHE